MLGYLWCAAGLVVLTIAADHLVIGSSRLAARSGFSPVVVGIVVIGLGTSMPEFLVSGVAAARGDTGIAVGNIVGSNIVNLTLILGVAAPSLAVFRTMLVTLTKDIPTGSGRPNVLFPILLLGWDKSDVADVALSDISASTAGYSVRHLDWPHSLYWPRG